MAPPRHLTDRTNGEGRPPLLSPGRDANGGRLPRLLARCVAVALVLSVTLPPQSAAGVDPIGTWCVVCGTRGTSGFLLNALLFLPLGLAVARPGGGARDALCALMAGALLSAAIEVSQLLIPGRHTALGDLLANSLGAGLGGGLIVTARSWLRPGPGAPRGLAAGWSAGVAFLLVGTAWALAPALPSSTYWVQEAPELGHLERFRGRVYGARAGELRLSGGRMSREARDELIRVLEEGPRLSAEVRPGPPPPGLAPVVSVYDGEQREIVLLGRDGEDLVVRLRRRADRLRLHRPELRAEGLLAGIAPDRRLRVGVRPEGTRGAGLCLRAGEERRCGVGHRLGRGWRLLLPAEVGPPLTRWLDAAWVALLFLPLGYWAGPGWEWRLGVIVAGGALLAAPAAGPVLPAGVAEGAGVLAGLVSGFLARRRLPLTTLPPDGARSR